MELVCVSLHGGASINALVIVVYRPPPAPSCLFFDELADLLERTATYSSLMLVGDLNLHLDVHDDVDTVKFELLVSSFNLVQHVTGATQVAGHLLDVVLTRGEPLHVLSVDVSPPGGLSDRSQIVCTFDLPTTRQHSIVRNRRCWRLLDTDAFKADLASSSLVQCPPDDVDELFTAYSDTLSSLVDKHAPLRQAARLDTKSGSVV